MFIRRSTVGIALIILVALGGRVPAEAQTAPATIQLQTIKGSYFFGITAGEGFLFFQGQTYPVGMVGLSVGLSIGGATADMIGEVYNLFSLTDIEGFYTATSSSYAVAGGDAAVILRNANGVEIHLRGKQIGLEFSIDLSGMSISLR